MANNEIQKVKSVSYGDMLAHLFLWEKAFLLVPVWAIALVPVIGFIFRSMGGVANQLGFGLLLCVFVVYFLEDLLKRKIRMDDENIFFGFKVIPIKSIQSVDVNYKKGKFLPVSLTLNCESGRKQKFKLSALTEDGVETLIKHIQAKNSSLKMAAVLNTLVKCRTVRRKPPESGERLDIQYNSRQFISENIEVFKSTAMKWARLGPVAVLLFVPSWMTIISPLYVSLHPHAYSATQRLNLSKFFSDLFNSIYWYIAKAFTATYESVQGLVLHPIVTLVTAASILGFFLYLLRLMLKPNHLVADRNGISLTIRLGEISLPVAGVAWSKINKIQLKKHASKAGKINILKDNGKSFEIDMSALALDDRASLLRRMEKLVPDSQVIDHELSQAMLPKSERSYTEIWLQSLNQSPQRKTLDPLEPGQYVGDNRFEVLKGIGVGGQGKAYLCRPSDEKESSTTVVLKETIIPIFADSTVRRKSLESFEQEARLLMSIDNPGIVKLMDYFVEDHRAYLVMEHIDGSNLRELVQSQGALPEEEVLSIALQMTEILKFLHEKGVVHRDFTPDNLILNSKGQLKLIDFNVAQQIQTGSSGTIVGKHAYLPPEQFRGKANSQSDLYAFGATLHYLLTGGDPEPISQSSPKQKNTAVSEELNQIVKRATALQCNNRYQSAVDLEKDLLALDSSESPTQSSDSSAKEGKQDEQGKNGSPDGYGLGVIPLSKEGTKISVSEDEKVEV